MTIDEYNSIKLVRIFLFWEYDTLKQKSSQDFDLIINYLKDCPPEFILYVFKNSKGELNERIFFSLGDKIRHCPIFRKSKVLFRSKQTNNDGTRIRQEY